MAAKGRIGFRLGAALAGAALWLGAGGSAWAQSFTLEGCRNNDGTPYPAAGPFICETGAYTTGNLGKGWNELDNVPFRLNIRTGQQAAAGKVALVVDREDSDRPGFDRISNATLVAGSSPTCPVNLEAELQQTPGVGGVETSLYRLLNYDQGAGLDCTYDFFARLALGSSRFPGASLHANVGQLVNGTVTTQGVGARDVSIPVKELNPPEGSARLSASAAALARWTLDKTADTANLNFGDVCSADGPFDEKVNFTVTWKKVEMAGGKVTVEASVSATNNASRNIGVMASGTVTAAASGTAKPVQGMMLTLAPNSTMEVLNAVIEFTVAEAGGVGDLVRFDPIKLAFFEPGNPADSLGILSIPAVTALITQGSGPDSTAVIFDTTSINPTASWLSFNSQQMPDVGDFVSYSPGSFVGGPIEWVSDKQTGDGSVTFTNVVRLSEPRVFNGTLSNEASLDPSDSASASAGPVKVGLSSTASVTLTITKKLSVPEGFLSEGQFVRIKFEVVNSDDQVSGTREVVFQANEAGSTKSVAVGNLAPDVYTVREVGATIEDGMGLNVSTPLHDPDSSTRTVDLALGEGGLAKCAGMAAFDNMIRPDYPTVKVEKTAITAPEAADGNPWTFTLTGPGLPMAGVTVTDDANDGEGSDFGVELTQPGTYTVTETKQSGWDLTSVVPSMEGSDSCTFTVSFPLDQGKVFGCSFTNTKRGGVKLIKTLNDAPLVGTSSFTFEVREGASTTSVGTVLTSGIANAANVGTVVFMLAGEAHFLIPGKDYQLCETGLPAGWTTSLSDGGFRPNSVNDPEGDNSTVCQNFTAAAGVTREFMVDNTPPDQTGGDGDARTIGYWKNHNDCKRSKGGQATSGKATIGSVLGGGFIEVGALDLYAADCTTIVNLLDKRDTKGVKRANLPEFNLASQLTAALLNGKAGAGTCPVNEEAKQEGQTLLVNAGFVGKALSPALSAALAAKANFLAGVLDDYNNNELCP